MAFPLEPPQLLTQLRASYVASTDNEEYARRIIKPFELSRNLGLGEFNLKLITENRLSPPITMNIGGNLHMSHPHNHHSPPEQHIIPGFGPRKKPPVKRKRHKKPPNSIKDGGITPEEMNGILLSEGELADTHPGDEQMSISSFNEDSNVHTKMPSGKFGLSYSKSITKKGKKPNVITKFFHTQPKAKNDEISDSDSEDSVSTQKIVDTRSNLELIEEESNKNLDEDMENSETPNDVSTLNSDFALREDDDQHASVITDEEEEEEDDDDDDYDEDYDDDDGRYSDEEEEDAFADEDDDESSNDSAFTVIETDSILDSSSLLESFNDGGSYSFGNPSDNYRAFNKKLKKKKSKLSTFDGQTAISVRSLTSPNILSSTYNHNGSENSNILHTQSSRNHSSSDLNRPQTITTPNKSFKKNYVTFAKRDINPDTVKPESNLSHLIQSRSKSANVNPLQFYSFANSDIESDNIRKTAMNIFVPPKLTPSKKDLIINDNVSVSDCIGYVLLSLSKLEEFLYIATDVYFMNPNHWRLELVDEDGENFGAFGILDRTRLLSSYNNPRDLAIYKVENAAEILKNEATSPLPKEFKSSLESFEARKNKSNSIIEIDSSPIKASADEEFVKMIIKGGQILGLSGTIDIFTPVKSSIEELLVTFCSKYKLDPGKYKLREIVSTDGRRNNMVKEALQPETFRRRSVISSRSLNPSTIVSQLDTHLLELVPTDTHHSKLAQQASVESSFVPGITPTDSSYNVEGITPPKKQLEERLGSLALESTKGRNSSIESAESISHIIKRTPLETIRRQVNSNKYLEEIISGKNPQLPTTVNDIYLKWKVWRKKPTILNKIEKSLIIDGDYIHLTPSEDTTWKKTPLDSSFSENQGHGSGHHNHHHYLHHYNYSNYYNKLMMKTSSFHITQITKLKQYKNSKNPNHFKIVIKKEMENVQAIKKKYDLEAVNEAECEDIINKIKYVLQVYNMSNMN